MNKTPIDCHYQASGSPDSLQSPGSCLPGNSIVMLNRNSLQTVATKHFRFVAASAASHYSVANGGRRRALATTLQMARGFTLLEVLMAVGLLAVISALVISTLSGGLRQVNWSGRASEASMHAQSLLDTIGTMEFIEPGSQEGDWEEGKYLYQLDIKEVPDPSISTDAVTSGVEAINPPVLYQIVLSVSWGKKPQEKLRFVSYKARQAAVTNSNPQF